MDMADFWLFIGCGAILAYGWMCVWIEENFFPHE